MSKRNPYRKKKRRQAQKGDQVYRLHPESLAYIKELQSALRGEIPLSPEEIGQKWGRSVEQVRLLAALLSTQESDKPCGSSNKA